MVRPISGSKGTSLVRYGTKAVVPAGTAGKDSVQALARVSPTRDALTALREIPQQAHGSKLPPEKLDALNHIPYPRSPYHGVGHGRDLGQA